MDPKYCILLFKTYINCNGADRCRQKKKIYYWDNEEICEEYGYKRHELGIIAAERAQLYFNGELLELGLIS